MAGLAAYVWQTNAHLGGVREVQLVNRFPIVLVGAHGCYGRGLDVEQLQCVLGVVLRVAVGVEQGESINWGTWCCRHRAPSHLSAKRCDEASRSAYACWEVTQTPGYHIMRVSPDEGL